MRSLVAAIVALVAGSAALAQPVPTATPTPPPLTASATATTTATASTPRIRPAAASPAREEGARWQSLTQPQRDALAPLEREWPGIEASRKQKWLAIAARYHSLPVPEQARISQRMTEWARLTPAERGEMRIRYQETRQVPAPDRSAKWEAYQKLGPDEKKLFAARAAASATAAASSAKAAGARDSANQAKANIVPNPALAQPPRAVAPTVVQASPGATTHLITRPAAPPAHQQTGMPKIATTPEFVNGSTLLPRRGPQAAAVVPMASASMAGKTTSAPMLVRPAAVQPAPAGTAASAPP